MLKPKRKLTKKEIKEDKFVKTTMQVRAYVEENYRLVTMITLGIFGLFIFIMFIMYSTEKKQIESASLLGQAQTEYQNLNYSKAKAFLTRLTEEYDGTDAADQGTFLLANLYFQEKNIALAKDNYHEFIDSYSGSEILIASGYAGLAACLSQEQDYEQAAVNYLKAQKKAPDFVEAADYLYLAGLNYLESGQKEKAAEMFRKIVEDYENSKKKDDAKARLILLASN